MELIRAQPLKVGMDESERRTLSSRLIPAVENRNC